METSTTIASARRRRDSALMVLFQIFLILPTVDWVYHIDPTVPPGENRVLAPFPAEPAGLAGFKKFLADWEAYFNDHFGFRNFLVTLENKSKSEWFGERNARGVLAGNDGWLYMSGMQMVEHFRGNLHFTEPELAAWQKLLEHRRDWLSARGIQYIFVLAPDKQSVYPEELPGWLKGLGGRTEADQFLDYMKAHSTVEVLDLRPVLLEAKKTAPIYQKTDTHWNNLGAFVACEEVIRRLAQKQLPELKPLPLNLFSVTNYPIHGGDLARASGLKTIEMNAVKLVPNPELPELDILVPDDIHKPAYSKNPLGTGKTMLFTDSYGRFWTQFMGYHFGEADFRRQYNLDAPAIEHQKPAVVINEMLERYFNVTDPHELETEDALP